MPWSPEEQGLVTVYCRGTLEASAEDFSLNAPWNTIKDIELSELDTVNLNVTGFVDTWVATAGDNASHGITVTGAKRGAIDVGNGNNTINVNYLSNDYTWSNHFHIGVGNGNNTIEVQPDSHYYYAAPLGTPLPSGWTFNTAPDQTTVGITMGSGDNTVELEECSGTITAGSGTSDISLTDGRNAVNLGGGAAKVTIAALDANQLYIITLPSIKTEARTSCNWGRVTPTSRSMTQ